MSAIPNPLRVDRLYLKEVGPFDALDLTFGEKRDPDKADLHVLVGPNGSGKSTVLYALAGLFGDLGQPRRLALSRMRTPRSVLSARVGAETIALALQPVAEPFTVPWPTGRLRPRQTDNIVAWFDSEPGAVALQIDRVAALRDRRDVRACAFAAFAYAGQRGLTSYRLDAIREPARGPFDDALSFTATADSATIVQWLATSHTKEALSLKDGNTAAAERFRTTRRQVEDAVRDVIGEDIRFEMSIDPLGITLRRGGVAVDLDVLPDGVKSIVSWVADLLSRLDRMPWEGDVPVLERPFLLLLDEVDIHLHPAWQRKVLPMVQRLFKNAQIVVSTHSPFVVASVSDAWVYPFTVKDGVASLGEVIPSQAGASVSSVLRTVFGVAEEFDVETEAELSRFYGVRDAVLAGDTARFDELERLAEKTAARGEEVEDIVASEVAQVAGRVGLAP